MSKSPNPNRLDEIEIQLTPKEWAIWLADESRRYASEMDFLRALAKGTFRESPHAKPCLALAKQAEDCHPGQKPENIRARYELNRRLQTEYQALRTLINTINGGVASNTEMSQLKIGALTTQLHSGLILRDVLALISEKTAILLERCKATDPDGNERELALNELVEVALAAGSRKQLDLLAAKWANDADTLLTGILTHRAAVQAVQENYFDGHAILYYGIEDALEATIQVILEAVATFNEYVSTKPSGLSRNFEEARQPKAGASPAATSEPRPSTLRVDVEAVHMTAKLKVPFLIVKWVTEARDVAIAGILKETGEHESAWELFLERVGAKQ